MKKMKMTRKGTRKKTTTVRKRMTSPLGVVMSPTTMMRMWKKGPGE